MAEKRIRRSNWSINENQVLEEALQNCGRNDIAIIHRYLKDKIPDFQRDIKDVKKKIYNYLQDNIWHEISVKVRVHLTYALLLIYKSQGHSINIEDQNIKEIMKFVGHDMPRLERNIAQLEIQPQAVDIGQKAIHVIMNQYKLNFDIKQLISNNTYIELLKCFGQLIDGHVDI